MTKTKGRDRRDIKALAHTLAELLDKVSIRAEAGYAVQQQLGTLMTDWKAAHGEPAGENLIQKAQGRVGMINSTQHGEPLRDRAYRDFTEYKQELRALARGA